MTWPVVCKGKTPVKFVGKVGPQVTAFMDWMRGIEEVEMEDCHIFSLTSFFNYFFLKVCWLSKVKLVLEAKRSRHRNENRRYQVSIRDGRDGHKSVREMQDFTAESESECARCHRRVKVKKRRMKRMMMRKKKTQLGCTLVIFWWCICQWMMCSPPISSRHRRRLRRMCPFHGESDRIHQKAHFGPPDLCFEVY